MFDESVSSYMPPTPDLDSNLSPDDEVSEAEMPPDEPEIRTRGDTKFCFYTSFGCFCLFPMQF